LGSEEILCGRLRSLTGRGRGRGRGYLRDEDGRLNTIFWGGEIDELKDARLEGTCEIHCAKKSGEGSEGSGLCRQRSSA